MRSPIGVLCVVFAVAGAPAHAQRPPSQQGSTLFDSLPGRTVARATAGPDTAQTFAVYYPSSYAEQRRWPVLFIMDPRGRAMLALRLFAPAAERYGFVVLSSYNTLSDGAIEPNIGAINAMLAAAQGSIAADVSRFYIAGFSGTARIAWSFELEAPKNFAGLFAAGAAPIFDDSGSTALLRSPGFAIAMTAGSRDFNWTEVRRAEQRLLGESVPAEVEYFDGPHGWPPAESIDRVLAWFKLRGVATGRWPADSVWLGTQIHAEIARIDRLDAHGDWTAAADGLAELSVALSGRAEAHDIAARSAEMAARPSVVAMRRRRTTLVTTEIQRAVNLTTVLAEARNTGRAADPAELARRLSLADTKRLAAQGDSLERPWADRVLALVQVSLGFYEPRYYLEQHQPASAVAMLQAFKTIAPWSPQHCAFLSQAAAMMSEADRSRAPKCD